MESSRGLLCATCAQRLDETPALPDPSETSGQAAAAPDETARESTDAAKGKPDGMMEHLEGMRRQIEAIHRLLLFEKTSAWNVIAGVAQCLAVGMLVVAAMQWLEEGRSVLNILMVTIVFQVMALTFFLKAK